jgi:aldose 1-epimerase
MPFKLGAAFCLETQYFPNSVNIPHFPSPIRLKGEPFESTTVYKFTVAK